MAYIDWDDKYLVDIPQFDEAHFDLFRLVNKLHELHSAEKTSDKKKVLKAFYDFLDYIYSHFSDEEDFLKEIEYPEIEEHKKLHILLKAQFEKHFKNLKNENLDMDAFLEFSKNWLQRHIMNEDQKYSQFKKNGHMT